MLRDRAQGGEVSTIRKLLQCMYFSRLQNKKYIIHFSHLFRIFEY